MKYFLLIFALMCSCACGSGGAGDSKATKVGATPAATLAMPFDGGEQLVFDTISLGRIGAGEIVNSSFAINNISDQPIVIVSVVNGCGCTTVDYDTKPIMASESRTINFAFNSEGRLGWQLKSIDVVMADHTMGRVFVEAEVVDKNSKN